MEKTPQNLDIVKELQEKSTKLVQFIGELKFEDYEKFTFAGTNFLLILTDPTTDDLQDSDAHVNSRSPAVFHASTAIDGFDVYLVRTAPADVRKRLLFHEMFEAILQSRGVDESVAHKITEEEEEKIFGHR